jgi:hypothetical protein
MIDAEFDRDDHSSIPEIANGRGLKSLGARTDLQTTLDGPIGRILVVKTNKKNNIYF